MCPSILILSLLALFLLPSRPHLLGQVTSGSQSANRVSTVTSHDVVPGVVVVKLKRAGSLMKGTAAPSMDAALRVLSRYGVTSLKRMFPQRVPLADSAIATGRVDLSLIHYATIPSDRNPVEIAAQLAALAGVEYAEPKFNYRLCDAPNDSDYVSAQQIYFDRMHVAEGWTLQKGSRDVVIATIDGGTNWQHPDLAANMWINPGEDINHSGAFEKIAASAGGDLDGVDNDRNGHVDDVVGWNFGSTDSCDPRGFLPTNAAHGTGTASDFGAVTNNGRGMAGTSWNCRVMAVCASHATDDDNICYWLEGLEYASRMGARVINCSFYRAGGPDNRVQHEQDVITEATKQGALIVAAAGNNNHQNLDIRPWYPASYDHVLSVGATNNNSDEVAYFSNLGLNVSVYAPGMAIWVARDDGSYGTDRGTSHSSPLVAGLAGLLFSKHPDWTPEMVAEQIRMTADPIDASNPTWAGSLGHGRVNFFRALSETHSGITVTSGYFHTRSGRTMFVVGDTVTLSVKVKNVLTLAAENLAFSVWANSELAPLGSIRGPSRLDGGEEDSVGCDFVVNSVHCKMDVKVKLGWKANVDEQDAHMFKTTLYSGGGYWVRQASPAWVNLTTMRAVNRCVVWASGFNLNTLTDGTILRTIDSGDHWMNVNGNIPRSFLPLCLFAVDSLHAWVGGSGGLIFATINGGMTWTPQSYPAPQSALLKAFWFFDAANGYAWGEPDTYVYGQPGQPGRYVILRTTNGGATWSHLANEPFGVTGSVGANVFCCTDKQHIWFGAPDSAVWRSTDGGTTWSFARVGNKEAAALAMRDDSVGIVCQGLLGDFGLPLIARTTDGGVTWEQLPSVKPDMAWGVAFAPGSTDAWMAGNKTVVRSHDCGATWAEQPAEPFSNNLSSISFSDATHGWMGTDNGEILKYRPVPTAVETRHEVLIPNQSLLEQNYPNPFNPKTGLRFQVSGISDVKITVYDLLGRVVAVLVNERKAPGSYEVGFDGSRLASGVYICRMTAGSFAQSRKMILIK